MVGEYAIKVSSDVSIRWKFGEPDGVAKTAVLTGLASYEPGSTAVLMDLVRQSKVFLDIGANSGVLAVAAAALNSNASVHAFEPLASLARRIERQAALNCLSNLTVHELALGRADGHADLHVPAGDTPSEASLSSSFRSSTSPVRVATARLDTLISEGRVAVPDLMKIDTESTEHDVMAGAIGTISLHRPVIVCEILAGCAPETEVPKLLAGLGYVTFWLTVNGPKRVDVLRGDESFADLNFAFVPEERRSAPF